MPKSNKDQIVGGKEADPSAPPPSTESKALQVSTPYTIQELVHKDIFAMYEAGVTPSNIAKKYPLYTPKEVLELCASEYDVTNIDSDQLDGVLLKGFLRDLQRLDKVVSDNVGNPELMLDASKALIDARERTVKYRQLLTPKLTSGQQLNVEPEQPVSWTIEQRLINIVNSKSPAEAKILLERLELASEDEINKILEGEFREVPHVHQIEEDEEGPPDPKTVVGD